MEKIKAYYDPSDELDHKDKETFNKALPIFEGCSYESVLLILHALRFKLAPKSTVKIHK